MANRFWNPAANANWGDANVWATTDGGDPTGIATPSSSDDVFLTSTSDKKCTINASADCKNFTLTGYTGTLDGTAALNIYGNLTLDTTFTWSYTGAITWKATSGTKTIETKGTTLNSALAFNGIGGNFQLLDGLTTSKGLARINGTVDANGFTVTMNGTTGTLTGGYTLSTLSLGSGTYTIQSNNTITTLTCTPATPPTIIFTGGTTQTITNFNISGVSDTHATIQSSNGNPFYLTKSNSDVVGVNFITISNCYAMPINRWFVGRDSTDLGRNYNLSFLPRPVFPGYISREIWGGNRGKFKKK